MKFSVDRGVMMQALSKVQGIADKKGSVGNVLSHILLESISNEALRMKCTDYDVVLISSFPAAVEKPGAIAINARSFYDSIRLWQDNLVEVETSAGGNINCRCGRTNAVLNSFPAEDFPRIEKDDDEPRVSLPAAIVSDIAGRMSPFMSDDPARMNLNGILLRLNRIEGGVVMTTVATDGHRMAILEREFDGLELPFESQQAIIHRKGVLEVRRLLEDAGKDNASIGFSMGEVVIRCGDTALFIRQIDEEFPNYSGVVPNNFKGKLRVGKSDLVNAVRIASPVLDNHSPVVKLAFKAETLQISSSRADFGNVDTEIMAEYEGDPLSVGYNFRFLLESLSKIDSDTIFLGVNGTDSPSLLRPDDTAEKSLFVIMPMDIP
jgi:DNA polymerase-3 subunit beta